MAVAAFSTFDALSAWGKTLPVWQRCLLVRLLEVAKLPEKAVEEVFAEYLVDQGLATANETRPEWKIELPQQQGDAAAAAATLAAIGEVSGVNALALGETLTFGPKLTVVYGPNGAGKSGYARVLKAACFTRSKHTEILGDVKLAKSKQPRSSATLSFEDGQNEDFVYGGVCPRLRDGFAVFDASCIHVHLDDRNAFQVMPYLFDVFPRMVEAFGSLQGKLRLAIEQRTPAVDKFAIADSETEVATLLKTLSDKTDLTRLQALAQFGDQEQTRLADVENQVGDLRAKDPKDIIKSNEQKIADLNTVSKSISGLASGLTPTLVSEIVDNVAKVNSLAAKGAALSAAQFADEPVQPIGTTTWRELLSAAIAYNDEAYPGETFPPAADGARCVLCQQTLDEAGANRLARFYQVATSDIEIELRQAKQQLTASGETVNRLVLDFFGAGSAARRTFHDIDPALEVDVEGHIEGYLQVANALRAAVVTCSDPGLELLVYDAVSSRVAAIAERLEKDNEALRLTDQKELIEKLSKEKTLLDDRKQLSAWYEEIAAAVGDLKWVAKASNSLRAFPVTQREVTTKQKTMMEELVAQGFIKRFTENCESLRLTLPVKFKFAGGRVVPIERSK